MAKILINDGIHNSGYNRLIEHGFEVDNFHIPQEELNEKLKAYDAICVRSATKVRAGLIDLCPNLKVIGRGGVGLDNIDVDHAQSNGVKVINTPAASSRSVAELGFAHLFSLSRFLYKSNQDMPLTGNEQFKSLKKSFSKGSELAGKTIGIIGVGRIGEVAAKIAYGLGLNVLGVDPYFKEKTITLTIADNDININVPMVDIATMLKKADIITLHVPFDGSPVISQKEIDQMKDGVILINVARGAVIDEESLLNGLNSGKVAAAGLDVFENEPSPRMDLLNHPNVSCTPHIGASTIEAQEKIGLELADKLIEQLS